MYFLKKTLDAHAPLLYNIDMKNDLNTFPGELNADEPNCSNCADSGVYENFVNERDFCDCSSGEIAHAEWCEEQDDFETEYEGGLFEDDGDALASAGLGTDEDYGGWD